MVDSELDQVIDITLHLTKLRLICQVLAQAVIESMSFWKVTSSWKLQISRYITASSAYSFILEFKLHTMSLIYVMNKKGPSTVPWGTPDKTSAQPDFSPFTWTRWERPRRNDLIHSKVLFRTPKLWNLCSNLWWGTLSKAFEKSSKRASVLILNYTLVQRGEPLIEHGYQLCYGKKAFTKSMLERCYNIIFGEIPWHGA